MSRRWVPGPQVEASHEDEIDAERRGWYELLDLVRTLTPDERAAPGYYRDIDWSVRDLVGHVGTWLAEAEVQFERINGGTYEGHDVDIDGLNAAFLEAMRDQPWDVAWTQATAGRSRMVQAWSSLPERTDEAAWWIRKAGGDHYAEHLPRLRAWAGELRALRRPMRVAVPEAEALEPWPEMPWTEWEPTVSTLHRWLQIVGKVRMALTPPLNHWWHTTLYVTSRGLTTSPIPFDGLTFQIDFDFLDHELRATDSRGRGFTIALEARSVASFYRDFMAGLRGLGIEVRIWPRPVEVPDAIPLDVDETHASYDPRHAQLLWRGLVDADRVMKAFQTRFVGKVSPVHVFWGGLDIATSRYSGRPAPRHPGGVVNCADWVMEEAYSREESAMGWWPTSEPPGPAFYAYAYPEPPGHRLATVRPADAYFDPRWGEFFLPHDAVRRAADADGAVLDFFQSVYEAGAELGGWDRANLEPEVLPDRPPTRPWSPMRGVAAAARSNREVFGLKTPSDR